MDKEDAEPEALLDKRIIANVFKFLRARDLANAASVCQTWYDVATNSNGRTAVQTMVVPLVCSTTYCVYEFRVDEVYSMIYRKYHLANFLRIKPELCLVFQDVRYPMRLDYSRLERTDHHYYRKQLPKEAKYFHVMTTSLMFDSWVLNGHSNLSLAMFFGSIPSLSVKVCVVDYVTTVVFNKKFDSLSDDVKEVLLTETDESACVLLFTSKSDYKSEGFRFSTFIFENLKDRYNTKTFRLWGGQVSSIVESTSDDLGVFLMAVRLSGPLLKCWTYVMRNGLAFNEYEEKFYSIKSEVRLTSHSMALVMAPVHEEDHEDLESIVQESYEDVFNLCEDMFPDLKFFYLFQTKGDVFSDAEISEDADIKLKYKNSISFLFLSYG